MVVGVALIVALNCCCCDTNVIGDNNVVAVGINLGNVIEVDAGAVGAANVVDDDDANVVGVTDYFDSVIVVFDVVADDVMVFNYCSPYYAEVIETTFFLI